MRGQNRLVAIALGVLAALVLVVGGLSAILLLNDDDEGSTSSAGDAGEPAEARAGVLRLAGTDPVTLDPALASDAGSAEFIVELFGGLVTIDPDGNLQLDLAASYEVSGDGLTYTFTLRDDIFFHTGRAVTANDVAYSIDRAASPELSSTTAIAYLGDIVGVRERFFGQADSISGIDVIDDRTISLTITEPLPEALFLAKLTYPTAYVVDQQQVQANPNNWTRRPNGTGPFKMREWRLGERIVLDANERYHLGAPALQQVVYELAGGSALTRFENGELDVAPMGLNDIERARDPSSDLSERYQVFPQFTVSYIALNTEVPPFDDVHVRRALALSIDRARIAEVTFSNLVSPATGILPPQLPGFTQGDKTYPFDPERARAELAESSYGSADALPAITLTEVGAGAEGRIDTQAFVEQWRQELGIEVAITQVDFATFLADQDAGRLQMFNAGWIVDYPDPENIIDLKFNSTSTLNDVGYSNPQIDEVLNTARMEQDPERRLQLYQQAEQTIIEDVAWIPLYFEQAHVVISEDVQGWFEPPMVVPRLRFVSVTR